MSKGTLYLIPNTIAEHTEASVITAGVLAVLPGITHFLAEDIRTARRYLKSLSIYPSIESLQFGLLNKDTTDAELRALLQPVLEGHNQGVISDSGCPGVADPGAMAVRFAHEHHVKVVPLVGPSSILLAIMGSGLNGQRFAFHGYLPIDSKESGKAIKELEKESRLRNQTQVFIETPYRSNALFNHLVKTLAGDTLLSIAVNLTSPSEEIMTLPVKQWKSVRRELPKAPVVFLFLAN